MYVEESVSNSIPITAITSATDSLSRLIAGTCSYPEAVNVCLTEINTAEPARRIQTILNIASGSRSESALIPRGLSKRCRSWSQDNDVRLLAGLFRYGLGDWKNIAEFVGAGKTGSQCSQRWSRALNPALSKEQWTEEEDGDLWDGVITHGQHSWAKVAKRVQSRSDVQCRYRFDQLKKMKKFEQRTKVVGTPLRLLESSVQLSAAELIPPLVMRNREVSMDIEDG
jgi:hypothetical protein